MQARLIAATGRYLEAARPRTLPAAVAPVIVGTAAADRFGVVRFMLALVVALSLQVAVNYANDLFDGLKGVDTDQRTGPRRAVASGLIEAHHMRQAMLIAFAVAGVAGGILAWLVGWELLLVGAAAILAALGYSGGSRPYASRGLGELSVFVFFGVVATVGSQYVQDGAIGIAAVSGSIPIGLFAVALLVVNNLRDIPQDRAANKRTLAVRLGESGTRRLFRALLLLALGSTVGVVAATGSVWPLIALAAAPLAIVPIRTVDRAPLGPQLIPVLVGTGRLQLVYAILLSVGLVAVGTDLTP